MNSTSPASVGSQFGNCATTSGLKPAPSITPITIVIGGRMTEGAATGQRSSAAAVQATIEPSIQGKGSRAKTKR